MSNDFVVQSEGDPLLVDVRDREDGTAGEAVFTDGSVVEFPPGIKLIPDNLELDSGEVMERLRYEPSRDERTGRYVQPVVWIPRYCTKEYLFLCIRRIVNKV